MAKVKVYNQKGEAVREKELNEKLFNLTPNIALIHQVVEAQQANSRLSLAHTKTRADVKGGGRKPWKQKGTGRARHGSNRSPIWVGGGITFGPRTERNFTKKLNKKMKQKALYMCLSDRIMNNDLLLIEDLKLESVKTKDIKAILKGFSIEKKVLVVLVKQNLDIVNASNNLENVKIILANSLNCVDILNYPTILMVEDAVEVIENTYKL
jgi:large subunit ribosomal protein L4